MPARVEAARAEVERLSGAEFAEQLVGTSGDALTAPSAARLDAERAQPAAYVVRVGEVANSGSSAVVASG